MKINPIMLFGVFLIGISSLEAQEKTSLTLDDAVKMAWEKSDEVTLANTKVNTKKYELRSTKNNQYPDLKASGQFQRLAGADVNLKMNQESGSGSAPNVDQLMLGQLSASLPIFAGFKIQNSIKLSENLYQAELATSLKTKEDIALRVVNNYSNLYKTQKTIELLNENQKQAKQRVTDFIELEKNGIIPRNDLLKSQLLVSKIQLSIDEANKNLNILNYHLITLLKLDSSTKITVGENDFINYKTDNIPSNEQPALENRKDLEALRYQEKASESSIKMAKSAYYPTVSLLGGYAAVDVRNILTVQNAMNFGVGVSYDLSGILKKGADIKHAQSKADEVKSSEEILTNYIKVEVQQAIENYNLALKQSSVYDLALEQASENYRILKDKFDNGLADTNDLLEADVEQLSAKVNTATSKADIIQRYYEMLSATGQLSQSFNLTKI
ncbi:MULTISPECIES: TolC family protein [unclassified Flavobacterium]|uniref:TolC family protein n=1 Tax=unclassified Flavobacterium TaxID=196869 RepID=UPI000F0CFDD2|nr:MULTISPECIES: TolC family protein [unclassified Flavobacterium]AYN04875.1 TolC family protein [Flavobacterium sp. 140616W15]MCD0475345.1 TolC family protein [Flavobacterium sp. EDS]